LSKTINIFVFSAFLLLACNKQSKAPLPIADFYVENNKCSAPCTLFFYDQSINAVKWRWDFDNGKNGSNADDFSFYISPGTYEVKLTIENLDEVKDSIFKTITVN
jgi:PKD repeat protein